MEQREQKKAQSLEPAPASTMKPQDEVTRGVRSSVRQAVHKDIAETLDYHEAFLSERYISALRAVPLKVRKSAIGRTLQYAVLHPDGFMFWDFVDALKDMDYDNFFGDMDHSALAKWLLGTIQRKLSLEETESREAKEKILRYCEHYLHENGCGFHGFNGLFEKDIREKGLTLYDRHWDWSDVRRIQQICAKAGYSLASGWASINCEETLSFSALPLPTYTYATNSPEWFGIFSSEGTHIPYEHGRRSAFAARNHELARSNMEVFCSTLMSRKPEDIAAGKAYPNITSEERKELLGIFEKYWKKFTGLGSRPCVAFVKNRAISPIRKVVEWKKWSDIRIETRMKDLEKKSASEIVRRAISGYGVVDQQFRHSIEKEDLEIFRLPDYMQLFPEPLESHPV